MPDNAPSRPIGNYSAFQRIDVGPGALIFVSGQVPTDSAGDTCGLTMTEQAEIVFKNLQVILEQNGGTFANILKVTIFLRDIGDFPEFNRVRNSHFNAHRPASTLVQVASLAIPEHRLEIEAIAYVEKRGSSGGFS